MIFFLRRRDTTMGQPRPYVAKKGATIVLLQHPAQWSKKGQKRSKPFSKKKKTMTHIRESTSHERYTGGH